MKQAQLLNALSKDPHLKVPALDEDDVLIFRKSKKHFEKWEHDLMDQYSGKNTIFDVFEASKRQCKVVLALSFYDFEELVALQPEAGVLLCCFSF